MKFIASIDTVIYGRSYAQGAEVDVTDWTRKQLLQCLDTGVIQGGSVTAASVADSISFSGPGVTTSTDADGNLAVNVQPIHVGSSPPPGDASTWYLNQLWVDTSTEIP